MSRPPGRSSRSTTVTRAPDARAPMPLPDQQDRSPPRQPWVRPPLPAQSDADRRLPHSWSLIARSLSWIVVGWPSTDPGCTPPRTSAGHTRLVNSGMGEVSDRRSAASSQRPRYTRSFHSGIRLCSGQPLGRAFAKSSRPSGKTPRHTSCSGSPGHDTHRHRAQRTADRNHGCAPPRGAARGSRDRYQEKHRLTHGTYASFLVEATGLAATDAASTAPPQHQSERHPRHSRDRSDVKRQLLSLRMRLAPASAAATMPARARTRSE